MMHKEASSPPSPQSEEGLPRAATFSSTTHGREESQSINARRVRGGKRILFVEDDADFREIFALTLREALAPKRHDVAFVEAGSLADARAALRDGLWTPR